MPISLKFLSLPYLWIGLAWTFIFFVLMMVAKRQHKTTLTAIYFNIAIVTLFLAGTEIFFWSSSPASHEKSTGDYWTPMMFKRDALLGFAPEKNVKNVVGERYLNDKFVFKMSVSTDQHGLRKSFPISDKVKEAFIFFGCSFGFGVGINDDETLPYQVGSKLNGGVNVYNFAYGGYGPQQMLSALEQGLVEKIVVEKPIHAFYVAISHHVERSAGLTSWNINDPKYELDNKGQIYYAGHFNDKMSNLPVWLQRCHDQLGKSFLWRKIESSQSRKLNDHDIERYVQMVLKAKTLFEKRYPDGKFHIVYWDLKETPEREALSNKVLAGLQKNQIPLYLVSNIIPNFKTTQDLYLIPNDGHPTPRANELIANYIAREWG